MKARSLTSELSSVICIVALLLSVRPGYTQQMETVRYPGRPVTFIVPLPTGSGGDLVSRLIAKEAERFLRQPIVIVNKPGGSHAIGVSALAAAKPDGYTIGYTPVASLFITPFLEKVPYHPLKDLQPVIQFGDMTFGVTVRNDSPFKSFKDLIAYARQNPKKLTYGTGGVYSSGHLALERIARREAVEFTHIPFKGGSEFQTALLGGHVQFTAGDFNPTLVDAREIRLVLLLAESPRPEYPLIPILQDIGYDIPYPAMTSVSSPKGLSDGVLKKLEGAFAKAMYEPAFIKGMKELHLTVVYRNSKELEEYVSHTYKVFEKLMKEFKPS